MCLEASLTNDFSTPEEEFNYSEDGKNQDIRKFDEEVIKKYKHPQQSRNADARSEKERSLIRGYNRTSL